MAVSVGNAVAIRMAQAPSSLHRDDAPMEPYVAALIGVAATAASLYSAHAKTMVPLRVAAIVGNILAMAYSFMLGTYLIFMLNAALLALHGWRLRAMLNLIRDIDVATGNDMNVDWLLPYTRPKHFKADDIMMERGVGVSMEAAKLRLPPYLASSYCATRARLRRCAVAAQR